MRRRMPHKFRVDPTRRERNQGIYEYRGPKTVFPAAIVSKPTQAGPNSGIS